MAPSHRFVITVRMLSGSDNGVDFHVHPNWSTFGFYHWVAEKMNLPEGSFWLLDQCDKLSPTKHRATHDPDGFPYHFPLRRVELRHWNIRNDITLTLVRV